MKICSHIFENWNNIPDISHLKEVENSYVGFFDHKYPGQSFVSYVIVDEKVVAFGSATHYTEDNYYYDEPYGDERRLWIEGLVSIQKGCGSLVLAELERWLVERSSECYQKIINVMSVDESIGFYEARGYTTCYTSSRFSGSGNTIMAKLIGNSDFTPAEAIDHRKRWCGISDEDLAHEIISYARDGRTKMLAAFVDLSASLSRDRYMDYIQSESAIFKPGVSENVRSIIAASR